MSLIPNQLPKIDLTMGETLTLRMSLRAKVTDEVIDMNEAGITPEAWIMGDGVRVAMAAEVLGTGEGRVTFDTARLVPGQYFFNVRLTDAQPKDRYTPTFVLCVLPSPTPPSPRDNS